MSLLGQRGFMLVKIAVFRYVVNRMILIAHNIRSLHNVGSIFRNAAAFGVEKVYLTGVTAVPPRKEIAKVALGAEDLVEWEYRTDGAEVIQELKKTGYRVYGLDNAPGAVDIATIGNGVGGGLKKIALVLGNEVDGIDEATKQFLDGLVEIPMEKKKSLNVSVASGVALYVLMSGSRL